MVLWFIQQKTREMLQKANNAFEPARYKTAGGTLRRYAACAPQFNRYVLR